MNAHEIGAVQRTLHTTSQWLKDLSQELEGGEGQPPEVPLENGNPFRPVAGDGQGRAQRLYRMLRAVLMALRDRLTVEEATDLGSQLPLLIRGFYYEGWNPAKTPTRERHLADFLDHVASLLIPEVDGDPRAITQAVFRVLERHVTAGQVRDVKCNLPRELARFWP